MTINIDDKVIDDFLGKAFFYNDLPGLAVSVSQGSNTLNRVLGYQNAVTKTALKDSHIFHMASVTKTLVGTSILMLCEQGAADPEDKLISFLPDFQMADPRYRDITLRHLLSHTSGMPDVKDYHWNKPETDEAALERYVYSNEVRDASLLWSPGEGRFAYSNMAYEILGLIISRLSGMPFEEYVSQNIFQTLEMKNSTLLTYRRNMEQVAAPHIKTPENRFAIAPHFPYNRAHGPSSTLTSDLADMGKWAKANLNNTLLAPETWQAAREIHALVPNNGEHICLSWFRREQNGYVFYGHEGNDDGFRASFWICPELDFYTVVCSNLSGAPVKRIAKQLFDLICKR